MIVENFPELDALDSEEKLILAGELLKIATTPSRETPELSEEAVEQLEQRLKDFERNPDTGVKWEDLRDGKTER